MRAPRLLVALLLCAAGPARAFDDPDTEAARRHFENGRNAYDKADYSRALEEFTLGNRIKRAPAFEYNIARCYDRMEEYPQAIRYYNAYVTERPGAVDASEVMARVEVLKRRMEDVRRAEQERRPRPPPMAPPDDRLLSPPAFDAPAATPAPAPMAAVKAAPAPVSVIVAPAPAARKSHTLAIVLGVVGGVAVVAGAVALAVVLASHGPDYSTSTFGPYRATP